MAVPALPGQHTAAEAAAQLSPWLVDTLWWCCETTVLAAQDWLQLSSTSAQLTAAGYSPDNLLQQLQSTAEAVGGANEAEHLPQSWVPATAQALEALGVTLNTLAIPHACNNPHCSNLSGPSELQLVGGRSATCAGCLRPATAASYASEPTGSSTSQCARPWQQRDSTAQQTKQLFISSRCH